MEEREGGVGGCECGREESPPPPVEAAPPLVVALDESGSSNGRPPPLSLGVELPEADILGLSRV